MGEAKELVVKLISPQLAKEVLLANHYSKRVVPNVQLSFGAFIHGKCEGVLQFGPSMHKKKIIHLVRDTKWGGFLELNRLAFSDALPRNSESRALSQAFRLIKRHYPHIEWVVSFADATQCGDGTIYRASGFVLTGITQNKTIYRAANGVIFAEISTRTGGEWLKQAIGYQKGEPIRAFAKRTGATPLQGFQLRYIYFLNKKARARLTVPEIPFSKIREVGASMYKGEKRVPVEGQEEPPLVGGAAPTHSLHETHA